MSEQPNKSPMLDWAEHAKVNDVAAKKVVMLDDRGNQFLGGGFNIPTYDYFSVTTPISTREIYTFKTGGVNGEQVAKVTINYTDGSKSQIQNATMS